jgi:hypothetical protein
MVKYVTDLKPEERILVGAPHTKRHTSIALVTGSTPRTLDSKHAPVQDPLRLRQ